MLSQRTVGMFQFLLEQMFEPLTFHSGSALTKESYSRLLYGAEIPAKLLDYILSEYRFNPTVFVRALHEGKPITALRIGHRGSTPSKTDTEAGALYLLRFAAVALRRWVELCSENYFQMGRAYDDVAIQLIDSLAADGFLWNRNTQSIVSRDGIDLSLPTLEPQIATGAKESTQSTDVSVESDQGVHDNADNGSSSKTRARRFLEFSARLVTASAVLSLVYRAWVHKDIMLALVGLEALAACLVVPEFRRRLGLDKPAEVPWRN